MDSSSAAAAAAAAAVSCSPLKQFSSGDVGIHDLSFSTPWEGRLPEPVTRWGLRSVTYTPYFLCASGTYSPIYRYYINTVGRYSVLRTTFFKRVHTARWLLIWHEAICFGSMERPLFGYPVLAPDGAHDNSRHPKIDEIYRTSPTPDSPGLVARWVGYPSLALEQ
ncbi:hypothetical protein BO70DRAFT_416019 [Aspergillus heteromorphus CBS 117.55]|uniref:Uncharacterized protein n=1 Tax=Aspergillus heteromorphus CBS 117.55 TaxID=1448321 RepID=A0A317VB44_9EURO|nr:uncharacterized protein BO70DRAFT_416019 [Aspergillus heteromorphus CBS 117.55]PWY70162.1 hypothetical protein BO70DRAFT_416019 [Aspergillus heteromorphus CBS 117.55]